MKLSILIVVLLGSLTAVGQGQGNSDGNDLMPMCKAEVAFMNNPHDPAVGSSQDWSMGFCLGVVIGVAHSMRQRWD